MRGRAGVLIGDDAVIAGAQALPGLRPCGFHSPYEAAAWSVLASGKFVEGWQPAQLPGQPLRPLAMRVSPMMTSTAAMNSVNTGVAAACTSLAAWAAKAASSA